MRKQPAKKLCHRNHTLILERMYQRADAVIETADGINLRDGLYGTAFEASGFTEIHRDAAVDAKGQFCSIDCPDTSRADKEIG